MDSVSLGTVLTNAQEAIKNLLPGAKHVVADIGLINEALLGLDQVQKEIAKAGNREDTQLLYLHDHIILRKAAKSLLSDIESMQCEDPRGDGEEGWFGDFEEYSTGDDFEEFLNVKWPNLAISADKLKKALEGKE